MVIMLEGDTSISRLCDSNYNRDKKFSDSYKIQVIEILKQHIKDIVKIEVSRVERDMKYASDFVVSLDGRDVCVRIRRNGCKYRDLTIRSFRATGSETELSKLIKGFGRWYLYCWENKEKTLEYMMIDLNEMRKKGMLTSKRFWETEKTNKDGKTEFVVISSETLENNGCIIASNFIILSTKNKSTETITKRSRMF